MKTKHRTRRGFTLVELLVVIVIIAALAGLTAPQVMKFTRKGDVVEATNNAKNLGLAFMEFDTDIGGYPDDSTIEAIEDITGEASSRILKGNTSNDYFRQFIESGIVNSEQPFFAKASYTKKPDDLTKGSEALKKGEVGFGYIMREPGEAISPGSGRPICAAPLKENSSGGEMETEAYDGKAIVLFTDNSVRQLNIRKSDSKAILPGGNDILKGGSDETLWGTEITPVMMAPQTK